MKPFHLKGKQAVIGLFLFLSISPVFAQVWFGSPGQENPDSLMNFYSIQKNFNNYWNGIKTPANLKNNERAGWTQFKRWEWFWEPRVYPTGKLPNPMQLFLERQKWNESHNSAKNKEKLQAAGDWTSAGPASSTGGYAGLGRINVIREDPNYNGSSNKIIYVGSASGGLWKTTDDGANWTALTDEIGALGITGICINPNNTSIIYIATGDGDAGDTYSVGVMKSTNGGASWNTTGLNWTTNQLRTIKKLIMNPNDPTELYAATSNGIYKTTNSGSNWTQVNSGQNMRDIDYQPGNTHCLYAADYYRVYRTTNGGTDWNALTNGLPTSGNFYSIQVAVSESDSNYAYALYGYYNFSGGNSDNNFGFSAFYRSTDRGASWQQMFSYDLDHVNLMGWESDGSDDGGQAWYDLDVAASNTDKNEVFVGGVDTWKSTDGGTSWACSAHWYGQNGLPAVHADHHCLWFVPGSSKLYDGNDGGAYRTTNGGTNWSWLGSGLTITQFYKIGVSQKSGGVVIGGAQDNGTKLKKWSSWTDVIGGDGMDCMIDRSDSTVMYGEYTNGDMSRSTNNGATWSNITDPNESAGWVTPLAMNYKKTSTIYTGHLNVWRSYNKGNSWTKISNLTSGNTLAFLAAAESDSNYIYAGTGTELDRTTNGGANWSTMNRPTTSASMTNILIDPANPNHIWATCSGYSSGNKVFYSTDGGTSWTNKSGALPNVPANAICYQKNYHNRIYVGTDIGVFYRDDIDTSWQDFNSNLPNVVIDDLEIQENLNKLYAGTYGRGIWSADLPVLPSDTIGTPALIAPADGKKNVFTTESLVWSTSANSDSYDLQAATDAAFNNLAASISGKNDTTAVISSLSLNSGTKYYWRSRGKKNGTPGAWSSSRNFTTYAYDAWCAAKANSCGEYVSRVQIGSYDQSSSCTDGYENDSLNLLILVRGSNYSFTVTGTNTNGTTNCSAWLDFNINHAFSDAGESLGMSGSPGTGPYTANISIPLTATSGFSKLRIRISNSGSLTPCGTTSTGEVQDIRIKIVPEKPILVSPINGKEGISITPTLDWNDISGVTYKLQLASDTVFVNKLIDTAGLTSSQFTVPDGKLANSRKYFWRVLASQNGFDGSYSQTFSFFTISGVPVSWSVDSSSGISAVVHIPASINPVVGSRTIQNGDAAGLFVMGNGVKKCAGYGIWKASDLDIKIWGDNPSTPLIKEAFAVGDTLKYELFDHLTGYTYTGDVSYTSGPDTFQKDSTSVLASLGTKSDEQLNLNLLSGWNFISSNFEPLRLPVDSIFKDIKSKVVIMKNLLGKTYIPSFNLNNIGSWNVDEAYQVYMSGADTLKIKGYSINGENVPINLHLGWKWISYLRRSPMNIAVAMTSVTDRGSLVIAKNPQGAAYIPQFNINNIGNMLPGVGYQIFLNQTDTLVFPSDQLAKSAANDEWVNHTPVVLTAETGNTGNNATIVLKLPNLPDGYEIGVKTESGLIAGSAVVNKGMAAITVWGNNEMTDDIDGAKPGEKLTFLVCSPGKRTISEFDISNISNIITGESLQNINYSQDLLTTAKSAINPSDISLFDSKFTPNPASDKAEFTFNMPSASHAKICIYTLGGKLAGSVFEGELGGGINSIPVNLAKFTSGIYIITCECGDRFQGMVFNIIK